MFALQTPKTTGILLQSISFPLILVKLLKDFQIIFGHVWCYCKVMFFFFRMTTFRNQLNLEVSQDQPLWPMFMFYVFSETQYELKKKI